MIFFRPPNKSDDDRVRIESREIEVKDKILQFNIDLGLKDKKYAKNFNNGAYIKSLALNDKFEKVKLDIADKKIKLAELQDEINLVDAPDSENPELIKKNTLKSSAIVDKQFLGLKLMMN